MTGRHYKKDKTIGIMLVLISDLDFKKMLFIIRLGKVLKIVENSTKGPPPKLKRILLVKNDLHVLKQTLYDMDPRVVAKWLLQTVSFEAKSFTSDEKTPTP